MRYASLFLATTLLGLSALACASGPAAASAAGGGHAAASVSAAGGSRADVATQRSGHAVSPGANALTREMGGDGGNAFAVKAMAVGQMMVGGEPATVLKVTTHAPLTAEQERNLKRLGYERYVDKWANAQLPTVYYCRRADHASSGAARDCYSFETLKDEPLDPKGPNSKSAQPAKDTPAPSGRAEYG
jgi:hypothetical protein